MSMRTAQKKDEKDVSHFETYVTDGSEKADKLARTGATLDEGIVAETRAKTAKQYAASVHCLVEEWKDCKELKPKPKENGFSLKRRVRIRSIERNGVLLPASTDA